MPHDTSLYGSSTVYLQTDLKNYCLTDLFSCFLEDVSQIVVTWTTWNHTPSVVEYGIRGMVLREEGDSTKFVDGGAENKVRYMHNVVLKNLLPRERYCKYEIFKIYGKLMSPTTCTRVHV